MNNESSGCYVIDSDYNIVNVNQTAKATYPQLELGKKCYKCLMNLDEPCGPCPVAAGRKGPATYVDPIRKISEIVDAVDIDFDGFGLCHMLIFATVENEAAFAATLPTTAEGLRDLALIKALAIEYYDVFSVNLTHGNMTLYRLNGKSISADSELKETESYEAGLENYIVKYVVPEDQEMMREKCSLEYVREALKSTEFYVFHYRVFLKGELHYFTRKIVRIGSGDSFDNIVVGIACEDEEVEMREKQAMLQTTLRKVKFDTRTGLLTKEAFYIYGDRLLSEYPELEFDFCIMKINNLDSINRQYGTIVKNKLLELIGEVLKSYEHETKCIAYLEEDSFGCYIEATTEEERKMTMEIFQEEVIRRSEIKNVSFKWIFYKKVNKTISSEETYKKVSYVLSSMLLNKNQDYLEFDERLLESLDWEISVEKNFRMALEKGEFAAWYQPKYSVDSQEIVGAEALVRWILPDGRMIPPNRFIPILENCGLINLLDEEIFRQTCRLQKEQAECGGKQVPISVNLSRASLFTKDIPQVYSEIAASYGVSPGLVPIEITESAAVRASMIGSFADAMIRKGFALHMDDFGSGYSSLASLQTIPFESIKIDKSLVDFIGNRSGESLLKHTVAFMKENGMKVIAEGVETMEQLMFLRIIGCDDIQGYYFSKPLPKEQFTALLKA